ncbi:hypothetical protein D3C73_818230 [compost metagenome]
MRGQLPDTDTQAVFLCGFIAQKEPFFLQRGQQPVHRAFVQTDLGGNLGQAQITFLCKTQQYIQRPFYRAYSQFTVLHCDLPFNCFIK